MGVVKIFIIHICNINILAGMDKALSVPVYFRYFASSCIILHHLASSDKLVFPLPTREILNRQSPQKLCSNGFNSGMIFPEREFF